MKPEPTQNLILFLILEIENFLLSDSPLRPADRSHLKYLCSEIKHRLQGTTKVSYPYLYGTLTPSEVDRLNRIYFSGVILKKDLKTIFKKETGKRLTNKDIRNALFSNAGEWKLNFPDPT